MYQYLCSEKQEYVLSKQVLRSGTSIGANVKEALRGQSRQDFVFKLNISLKEASETEYWLELLDAKSAYPFPAKLLAVDSTSKMADPPT